MTTDVVEQPRLSPRPPSCRSYARCGPSLFQQLATPSALIACYLVWAAFLGGSVYEIVREFERFFDHAYEPLVGHAFLLTGNIDEARDLVQEVMFRAWRGWSRLSNYENRDAWARRVLHNLAIGRWRKHQAAARRSVPVTTEITSEMALGHLDIVAALNELPVDQRRAIVLHDIVGLSVIEVAKEMRSREGTVKSWLSRGRAALAVALGISTVVL